MLWTNFRQKKRTRKFNMISINHEQLTAEEKNNWGRLALQFLTAISAAMVLLFIAAPAHSHDGATFRLLDQIQSKDSPTRTIQDALMAYAQETTSTNPELSPQAVTIVHATIFEWLAKKVSECRKIYATVLEDYLTPQEIHQLLDNKKNIAPQQKIKLLQDLMLRARQETLAAIRQDDATLYETIERKLSELRMLPKGGLRHRLANQAEPPGEQPLLPGG